MTPGSIFIKKCSVCSKLLRQYTIGSGNTFGATYWTDGKCEAPMLPDEPWMVLCPHCHAPLWIDELKVVEELTLGLPDRFKDALKFDKPSADDHFALLEAGRLPAEKERYLRLPRAWWAGNDERRTSPVTIPLSAREVSNLEAFAPMLDESEPSDLITKVEIMRELGRFDDAAALLAKAAAPNLSRAVGIIGALNEQRDPSVRQMTF